MFGPAIPARYSIGRRRVNSAAQVIGPAGSVRANECDTISRDPGPGARSPCRSPGRRFQRAYGDRGSPAATMLLRGGQDIPSRFAGRPPSPDHRGDALSSNPVVSNPDPRTRRGGTAVWASILGSTGPPRGLAGLTPRAPSCRQGSSGFRPRFRRVPWPTSRPPQRTTA